MLFRSDDDDTAIDDGLVVNRPRSFLHILNPDKYMFAFAFVFFCIMYFYSAAWKQIVRSTTKGQL